MSRFAPDWLALREPADLAARNKNVLAACAHAFAGHSSLNICDIGSGTGASVRAFAHLLPPIQNWTLIDHDAENLARASHELTSWANTATHSDDNLLLQHGPLRITVRTQQCDLAARPDCWPIDTELVTASALFDLTSEIWIAQFVAALQARQLSLLATLTFDGAMQCEPPHHGDAAIRESFLLHQMRDKGFGPAAGALAVRCLENELKKQGYTLTTGESPWLLDRSAQALLDETLDGISNAASETGNVTHAEVLEWRRKAKGSIRSLKIGHCDIFAQPL